MKTAAPAAASSHGATNAWVDLAQAAGLPPSIFAMPGQASHNANPAGMMISVRMAAGTEG